MTVPRRSVEYARNDQACNDEAKRPPHARYTRYVCCLSSDLEDSTRNSLTNLLVTSTAVVQLIVTTTV